MNHPRKKVVVMGLGNINNYGDNFILQNVKYLIERTEKYETKIVDFELELHRNKFFYYIILCISKVCILKTLRYKLIYLAVKIRCKKEYEKEIEKSDALIFACGSFKYGTQKLWAYYSLAIDIAEKNNIPVMFNAMNIQKYDEKDWRCQFLKKQAKKSCVKMITCRDGEKGVQRLKNDYEFSDSIFCAGVGDVAFWMKECYKIETKEKRNIVGINLINGNIFRRYGGNITEEQLLEIYNRCLKELDRKGISWELFTNGLEIDNKFGMKLLKRYGNTNIKIHIPTSDVELIKTISSYKMILGARLHASICAYALDIPFIGFVWDEKLLDFSTMAEIEGLFINEDELSSEEIIKRMDCFQEGLNEKQKKVRTIWKEKTKEYINLFLIKNM